MSRLSLLFLAALAILWQFPCIGQSNELTIPLTNPGQAGQLDLHVFSGTIEIKGSNRKDILMRYEMLDESPLELTTEKGGMKRLGSGGVQLEVWEKDNEVQIESGHENKAIALYLEIPQTFDLSLNTHHYGDISVSNITGEIVIEAHHGGISAKEITGSVVANTWHGDIVVDFVSLNADRPMALTTYHGKVDVSLPANAKAALKLRSNKGEVFTDFDVALNDIGKVSKERKQDGTYQISIMEWISGTINGGGAELMAKTHSADVYIRRK